jgi:hypothetical protein
MNTIKFEMYPSDESNDHQVRIIIDSLDFLGNDYLGIDPPFFFTQKNLFDTGELLIGRCTCGCEGCGDYHIEVSLNENSVIWSNSNGLRLEFDRTKYENTVSIAKNDYSWEDKNRRVERYVSDLLKQTKIKNKYIFNWASARIKENVITLSYSSQTGQMLFEILWDGESVESGIIGAEKFIYEHKKQNSFNV